MSTPRALTVAGSDPTGGAGVARDLVTFAALGVRGACALTAVTVQDATGVHGWIAVPARDIARQVASARADGFGAAKTGMLPDAEAVRAVAAALDGDLVVVDPVLVATSGGALAGAEVPMAMREALIPRAALVTPNAPEAEALTGVAASDPDGAERAGRALVAMGAGAALITGGHGDGDEVVDVLVTPDGVRRFANPRLDVDAHGSGCAVSAAVAAGLAAGMRLEDACARAIEHVRRWLTAGGWRAR